jgi:ribonuclease P protein component
LNTVERYRLKKDDKLKSRKAIELLFSQGKSFSNFPFRVCWLQTDYEIGLKAGFSATSRNFKKATDRNTIKRLIREAYRLQKNVLASHYSLQEKALHIFFIYTGKDIPTYEIVFEKIGTILKRIIKLLDENQIKIDAKNNEGSK